MISKSHVEPPPPRLTPARANTLLVASRASSHVVATWNHLVLVVWRGPTTLEAIEGIRASIAGLVAHYPGNVGILQVVEPSAPPPDAEARSALSNVLRAAGKSVACSGIVFEGTGFKMAAVRAIVTGLTMLARPEFPHLVFADVQEASKWMCARLPSLGASGEIGIWSAVNELRDLIGRLPVP